jgi:hypothetical protein
MNVYFGGLVDDVIMTCFTLLFWKDKGKVLNCKAGVSSEFK